MLQQITFENKNKNSFNINESTLTDQNINQIKNCVNNVIDYLNTNELFILSGADDEIISLSTFVTRNEFNNLSSKYITITQSQNYITRDQSEDLISALHSIESYITQYDFINTLKNYTLKSDTAIISTLTTNLLDQIQNNIYNKSEINAKLNNEYYSKNNVYNKSQIDNFLSNYFPSSQIQNLISNYNTKTEITQLISNYCLKSELLQICLDYYSIEQLQNYLNLNYYTKSDIDSILDSFEISQDIFINYYTKSEIDNKLAQTYVTQHQIDISFLNYYTKSQVNQLIISYLKNPNSAIEISLENYYTKSEIDNKLKDVVSLSVSEQTVLLQKISVLNSVITNLEFE